MRELQINCLPAANELLGYPCYRPTVPNVQEFCEKYAKYAIRN